MKVNQLPSKKRAGVISFVVASEIACAVSNTASAATDNRATGLVQLE